MSTPVENMQELTKISFNPYTDSLKTLNANLQKLKEENKLCSLEIRPIREMGEPRLQALSNIIATAPINALFLHLRYLPKEHVQILGESVGKNRLLRTLHLLLESSDFELLTFTRAAKTAPITTLILNYPDDPLSIDSLLEFLRELSSEDSETVSSLIDFTISNGRTFSPDVITTESLNKLAFYLNKFDSLTHLSIGNYIRTIPAVRMHEEQIRALAGLATYNLSNLSLSLYDIKQSWSNTDIAAFGNALVQNNTSLRVLSFNSHPPISQVQLRLLIDILKQHPKVVLTMDDMSINRNFEKGSKLFEEYTKLLEELRIYREPDRVSSAQEISTLLLILEPYFKGETYVQSLISEYLGSDKISTWQDLGERFGFIDYELGERIKKKLKEDEVFLDSMPEKSFGTPDMGRFLHYKKSFISHKRSTLVISTQELKILWKHTAVDDCFSQVSKVLKTRFNIEIQSQSLSSSDLHTTEYGYILKGPEKSIQSICTILGRRAKSETAATAAATTATPPTTPTPTATLTTAGTGTGTAITSLSSSSNSSPSTRTSTSITAEKEAQLIQALENRKSALLQQIKKLRSESAQPLLSVTPVSSSSTASSSGSSASIPAPMPTPMTPLASLSSATLKSTSGIGPKASSKSNSKSSKVCSIS